MAQFRALGFISILMFAAACTQQQAPVDDRSGHFYGRNYTNYGHGNSSSTYASEYVPAEPSHYADPAPAPSVAMSDLPPPTAAESHVTSQPISNNQPISTVPSHNAQSASIDHAPPYPVPSHASTSAKGGKFIWPVDGGKIISHFGNKANDGINIAVAEGEPIWAASDGMVVYAGDQLPSYGNMVIVRHENGLMTAYAHARNITVRKNDYVKQGEIIGYVGQTGSVKSPQLHFSVRNGKTPVDPERYLPGT